MGLFDFLKSKKSEKPVIQENKIDSLESFNLPDLDEFKNQPLDTNLSTPSINESTSTANTAQKSATEDLLNLPPIDSNNLALNLPNVDTYPPVVSQTEFKSSAYQSLAPLGEFTLPNNPEKQNIAPIGASKDGSKMDPKILSDLFMSDGWKEPDWKNFDPYTEPSIEEPKPQDFGMTSEITPPKMFDTEPSEQVVDTPKKIIHDEVDVFIRSDDCKILNKELMLNDKNILNMNESLNKLYSHNSNDQLYSDAKNNIELLIKKLAYIEKKLS